MIKNLSCLSTPTSLPTKEFCTTARYSIRNPDVDATIYTANISKQFKLDVKQHNAQYSKIEVKQFTKAHDRFLIIDNETVYHIGASLKDLGKKWFVFSKINLDAKELINKLSSLRITDNAD